MAVFHSGVSGYVVGQGAIINHFPVDLNGVAHICCGYCDFYSGQSRKCRITGEIIYKPDTYVGNRCPLSAGENHKEEKEI